MMMPKTVLCGLINKLFRLGLVVVIAVSGVACALGNTNEHSILFRVRNDKDRLEGFINQEGKIVLPLAERNAGDFSEGLAAILDKSGWHYMDEKGSKKIVLGKRYQFVGEFVDGLARVEKNGLVGFIDKEGREVVKPQYKGRFINHAAERIALPLETDGDFTSMRLVDLTGKEIVMPSIYAMIVPFHEGLFLVAKPGQQIGQTLKGIIDRSGKEVVPVECEVANLCSEGIVFVSKSGVWAGIDTNGTTKIKGDFLWCTAFSEGLAATKDKKTERWGYIDHEGKWKIEPRYEGCAQFSEELAAVVLDDKWGFIDKDGNMIVSPQFIRDAGVLQKPEFHRGLARIWKGRDFGYIDRAGKWVWKP